MPPRPHWPPKARSVFTLPEHFCDANFRHRLSCYDTSLLVVDEAHCISQSGHDFLPGASIASTRIDASIRQLACRACPAS